MVDCRKCQRFSACYSDNDDCIGFVPKDYPKSRTNYDHLVSKSLEELAAWLNDRQSNAWFYGVWSRDAWLDWLKQEVDE